MSITQSNSNQLIDESMCRELRDEYGPETSFNELAAEYGVSDSTIKYHVGNRCACGRENRKSTAGRKITAALCQKLRETYLANENVTYDDLADDIGVSYQTVWKHIKGECVCKTDIDPVSTDVTYGRVGSDANVTENECGAIRLLARENYHPEELTWFFQYSGRSPIKHHVRGECECETDVPPLPNYRRKVGDVND